MTNYGAPSVISREMPVPAVTIAATTSTPILEAPFAGAVSGVQFTPAAAITGANTNTRKVELINKGLAGAGTTVMATLQFDAAVNGVAFDEKDITLSVVANALNVVAGDILAWVSTAVGTGLADPGGRVQVAFTRVEGA